MTCECGRPKFVACHQCGAPVCLVHAVLRWDEQQKSKPFWLCQRCRDQEVIQARKARERSRAVTPPPPRCEGCD